MQRMVSLVHKSFLPQAVVLFNDGSKEELALIKMAPYVEGQKSIDGKGYGLYLSKLLLSSTHRQCGRVCKPPGNPLSRDK
jgi:hypothetical protein